MKNNYLTLILFFFITSLFAQKNKKNLFKINSVSLFSGVYEFQYERVLSDKNSIQFGFGTENKSISDRNEFQELHLKTFRHNLNNPINTEYSEKYFSINFDYRYYFKGSISPKGLYISPSIQYFKNEESFSALEQESGGTVNGEFNFNKRLVERSLKLYNFRTLIGYQLLIANTISFNPYFGPSYAVGDAKSFFDVEEENIKTFGFNVGIYFGINF